MSLVRATTIEERRILLRRQKAREQYEREKAAKTSEEEEVAAYLSICPMFMAGLLELNESNFISLMQRTRQFMLQRLINKGLGELHEANHLKLREKMAWGL